MMKTNIKARITCLFISKTTIMVNKCEIIYFIRLSSFFISLILSLFFYWNLFHFNFVVSERNMHILFLPTYLGGTFSPLLDISELPELFFPGGGVHVHPVHPPLHVRLSLHVNICSFIEELAVFWQLFFSIPVLFLRKKNFRGNILGNKNWLKPYPIW